MAGMHGDGSIPLNGGNDNRHEQGLFQSDQQETAEGFRRELFNRLDNIAATPDRQDAAGLKKVADSLKALASLFPDSESINTVSALFANLDQKYFQPDHTGTSRMDRMKNGAPELYARQMFELKEQSQQTRQQIEQFTDKLKKIDA